MYVCVGACVCVGVCVCVCVCVGRRQAEEEGEVGDSQGMKAADAAEAPVPCCGWGPGALALSLCVKGVEGGRSLDRQATRWWAQEKGGGGGAGR